MPPAPQAVPWITSLTAFAATQAADRREQAGEEPVDRARSAAGAGCAAISPSVSGHDHAGLEEDRVHGAWIGRPRPLALRGS